MKEDCPNGRDTDCAEEGDAQRQSKPLQHYGTPGIGGSLGVCALCGGNFLAAIVLESNVTSFSVSGCSSMLYAHNDCATKYAGQGKLDVLTLPEKSPLRQAYKEAAK